MRAVESAAIARDMLLGYFKQIVVDGIFYCDPHPGNTFVTDDRRLALMDFGMVGRFDSSQEDKIILLLLAFSERQGVRVAETYLDMIEIPKSFDRRADVILDKLPATGAACAWSRTTRR